ncbi:hypothetical protein ABFA07_003866 [Porites harrisoni]
MARRAPPRTGRKESITDLVKDLELLHVDSKDYGETKESMAKALDLRIEELKKSNGTLLEGYDKIVKDLKQTRKRRHVLKDYYSKIKEVLSDTQGISLQEEADFVNRAVLVAGETSAGKSSLINLLLNEQVLPTSVLQNTLTICEISYGAKREAVIHFGNREKTSLRLGDIKSDTLKQYIQKPTNDKDWCKKIEIKIPNSLLKGGVVIVDSPGIGDSEQVCNIALEFLPQAFAFIYVINSPNAGGMQDDRLMRIVKEWNKLYRGDKCKGLTSESALFVCNKWDDVERQTKTNLSNKEKIKNEIICKLKKKIPNLNEKSQVIEMSVFTAAQIHQKFGVMSDDLSSLINGLRRLLPLCLEKKTEHFYRMNSGCLKSLSDQVKGEINNAKRSREDRFKAQKDVEVKLEKLKDGAFIKETDKAISRHVKNISTQVKSCLQQDEVRSAFCTWEEKDLPQIDDSQRGKVERLKNIYNQSLEQRFEKILQTLEKREQLFSKAHADLEQRFRQGFFEFEKDVRDIDQVLVGESTDEVLLQFEDRSPLDSRVKKFIFLTSVVFMPVLFPIGLAAAVLSAPVIGYLAIERILNERHLRNDPCQVLRELSTHFLQKNIDEVIFDRVSQEFTDERERIDSIKRCYKELLEKYEKKCKDLTKCEDEETRKGTVEMLSPLYTKLEDISQNLTFDAIQHGIRVMSPSCEVDKRTLYYETRIGGGSYGDVYKGKISLPGSEKEVAVKKLKEPPQASNVAPFLGEANILMKLKHTHIVEFYGVVMDVQDNQLRFLALVFELCKASLKNHIFKNEENKPWRTNSAAIITCRWAVEILDALEFIHSKKIVHRDLKLDNVLITKMEHIKVADLGLATFRNQITGTYCGTPWYMAPEIRENKIYDSKVDMYSFGLMMWEMWFGEMVPSDPISWSQDKVTRQIDKRKQRAEGRGDTRHPPPAKWIELMVSLSNAEPCLRKTATESKELMKKLNTP